MTKIFKLLKTKLKIIELMRQGWELGRSASVLDGGRMWWLQKGGLGKGGETYTVRDYRTGYALQDLGLIERSCPNQLEFPTEHWRLTKLGRKVKLELA